MRKALFIVLVVALVALSGCSFGGSNTNQYKNDPERFFVGKQGVVATYQDLPQRLYYYGPTDNSGNEFTFSVKLQNMGASYTRGGVFVSGFDPRLLVFKEIPIQGGATGACGFSLGSIGFGQLGGIFRCDGMEVSGGDGVFNARVNNIGELINGISQRFGGTTWFDTTKFNIGVNYQNNPVGSNFAMTFNGMEANYEYYQHGRLFIAILSSLNFRQNGGQEFLLAGTSPDYPPGEETMVNYNGKIVDWPNGLDMTTQHMLLTTCYQYTTFADPIVCIDPEPDSDNRKVCKPQSRTWGGGNGAPVSITSVEQENTRKKIMFTINVKNIGTGTVYDAGKLEKCSPYYPGRVTGEDLNVVYLGDVRIGTVGLRTSTGSSGGMQCSPTVIKLDPKTKTGSTTCSYPIEFTQLKSAYTTPLVVELWYGYSEAQQRDITIKRQI